jgi:hypothetical protein
VKRKRDTPPPPEVLLQRVIRDLEQSDRPNHPSHRNAVLALLSEGPLLCGEALLREIDHPDPGVSLVRAELIQFLRTTVRLEGQGESLIWLDGPVALVAMALGGGRVQGGAKGTLRAMAVLQMFLLMQQLGLRNIRTCGAAEPGGCQRLFVKAYRREFCSARCQQRDYKRKLRQRQRELKEQQTRRRRITKGTS